VPKPEKLYETGRAFTYLLLKESVANDVINISLFAYDKITLKTQSANKRRQDIDKQETQLSLRDRATRACQLKSGKVLHKCRRLVFEKL